MHYTKDGLSINKTEREAQLSQGIKQLMQDGEIIEAKQEAQIAVAKFTKTVELLIKWLAKWIGIGILAIGVLLLIANMFFPDYM